MNTTSVTISACFIFSVPLAIISQVEAQEGGGLYPKGDPGLYRSVETEIKIEPNFRKQTNKNSPNPAKPKEPLIPPPPIPSGPDDKKPVEKERLEEKPIRVVPSANPHPKTSRSQLPSVVPAPQFPEPERRVELQNNPRIEVPSPPPDGAAPRDAYPPQNPYRSEQPDRSENRFPRMSPVLPMPSHSVPAPVPSFPEAPRAFPVPSLPFPCPPQTAFPEPPWFRDNGATVSELREAAHSLSRQGIKYKYGHFTPRFGGLDSSGSVQFLLTELGMSGVPRTIGGQLAWSKDHDLAHQFEFRPTVPDLTERLESGNLIFWGDFETGRLAHVMVYLGYDNELGKHFAFGTRGGTELGLHGNEVDVFELKLGRERIVATAKIPGLSYR